MKIVRIKATATVTYDTEVKISNEAFNKLTGVQKCEDYEKKWLLISSLRRSSNLDVSYDFSKVEFGKAVDVKSRKL